MILLIRRVKHPLSWVWVCEYFLLTVLIFCTQMEIPVRPEKTLRFFSAATKEGSLSAI